MYLWASPFLILFPDLAMFISIDCLNLFITFYATEVNLYLKDQGVAVPE